MSGEAGLGKTTADRGGGPGRVRRRVRVCCSGIARRTWPLPYQLFTEALGHFVTHAPQEQLVAHVESWGSELARLVPALSSRLPGLGPSTATDADTERYQVFAAVVGLLVMVSQAQPVVLVLDDLQWADRASLQLLRHLVGSRPADAAAGVGHLSRHGAVALPPVGGDARRRSIATAGWRAWSWPDSTTTGVVSLMEAAAGHALDDTAVRLARALHRETDGNPFFVSEVLRHLAETGAIYQDAATGRWVGRGAARRDGVAGQCPHRDRRAASGGWDATPSGCCRWPR